MEKKKRYISYIFAVLLILGCIAMMYPKSRIIQSDTAWHIKVGEWICNNKSLPTEDSFSIHENLNFIAHEWLFDVVSYKIDSLCGTTGIIVFGITTVFIAMFYICIRSNHLYISSCIFFLMTVFNFYKPIMTIPDTLACLIFIMLAINLIDERRTIKKKVIINIILSLFLVNWHGGMMTASLIQGLYILGTMSFLHKENIRDYGILLFSSIICCFVNPYTIKIITYIAMINTTASSYITDWIPYSFPTLASIFIILGLIILTIIGYQKVQNKKVIELFLLFFYGVMLFRYTRSVNMFSYMLVFISSKYIYELKLIKYEMILKTLNITSRIIFVCISIFIIIAVSRNTSSIPRDFSDYIEEKYISEEMREKMKTATVFNTLDLSGFMIYEDIPVFIDGRIDPYTPEYNNPDIFMEFEYAINSSDYMNLLVKKYNIEYLLLKNNTITAELYKNSKYWNVEAKTEEAILLSWKGLKDD